MGKMALDPKGAALTTPKDWFLCPRSPSGFTTGCDGRNGAKWALTPIGPTPENVQTNLAKLNAMRQT